MLIRKEFTSQTATVIPKRNTGAARGLPIVLAVVKRSPAVPEESTAGFI
jgi:hypothetical protein